VCVIKDAYSPSTDPAYSQSTPSKFMEVGMYINLCMLFIIITEDFFFYIIACCLCSRIVYLVSESQVDCLVSGVATFQDSLVSRALLLVGGY